MATHADIQAAEAKARKALAVLRIMATRDHNSFPKTEDEWASLRKYAREIESACALRFGLIQIHGEAPSLDRMEADALNATERVRPVRGHGVNE